MTAIDELGAPSRREGARLSTRLLPDLTGNGALSVSLLLGEAGIWDLQGFTVRGSEPSFAAVADEALQPVSARVRIHRLASDPGADAAYAEGQPWTRDPRGPRVQSDSPRIPHGKVTTWLRPIKIPCQGAIID